LRGLSFSLLRQGFHLQNGKYCSDKPSHLYQQTFIDTYAKVGFAKLYDRKTPITGTDLLNDRVLPF
jgi:hypothetical protein